jgi:hypothetical protein
MGCPLYTLCVLRGALRFFFIFYYLHFIDSSKKKKEKKKNGLINNGDFNAGNTETVVTLIIAFLKQ